MDTIRTAYIDSAYAEETTPGNFKYNIVGGLSVPEGARCFIDNISFTNTFSNVIGEKNNQVFPEDGHEHRQSHPGGSHVQLDVHGKPDEPPAVGRV